MSDLAGVVLVEAEGGARGVEEGDAGAVWVSGQVVVEVSMFGCFGRAAGCFVVRWKVKGRRVGDVLVVHVVMSLGQGVRYQYIPVARGFERN